MTAVDPANGDLAKDGFAAIKARFHMPLTEMIRPKNFAQYIGQDHLLNPENGEISNFLRLGYLPSMVLCGPPGVGKTSLARLLAEEANYVFVELSATSSTVADLRDLSSSLEGENTKRSRRHVPRLRVLVFIDEIHRFSTVQQDYLLPFIESGAFVFVGATTTDPQKSVRRAILSRCQLFKLSAVSDQHLEKVIFRAILHENIRRKTSQKLCFLSYDAQAVQTIVKYASGDMRSAVNVIEIVGKGLSSANYRIENTSSEITVDESLVSDMIKTLSKERFGLYSENNIPLLAHLLKSLRYPQSHCRNELPGDVDSLNSPKNENLSSRTLSQTPPADDSPCSDLESWFDESEEYPSNDPNSQTKEWADRMAVSDDEAAEAGPLYSEDEEMAPIYSNDLSLHSASKFRILSSTHACLQLLQKGESPLSILKYLFLFICTHADPEKGELVKALSVLKAVQKTGVGAEQLLFNCIERLAGTRDYEINSLRETFEATGDYCDKNKRMGSDVPEQEVDYEVIFDPDLVEKLLRDVPDEKEASSLGMEIVSFDSLGSDYSVGGLPESMELDCHNGQSPQLQV